MSRRNGSVEWEISSHSNTKKQVWWWGREGVKALRGDTRKSWLPDRSEKTIPRWAKDNGTLKGSLTRDDHSHTCVLETSFLGSSSGSTIKNLLYSSKQKLMKMWAKVVAKRKGQFWELFLPSRAYHLDWKMNEIKCRKTEKGARSFTIKCCVDIREDEIGVNQKVRVTPLRRWDLYLGRSDSGDSGLGEYLVSS